VRSTANDPYTSLLAWGRLDMEQQLIDSKSPLPSTLVLAATMKSYGPCQPKSSTNPKCPPERRIGHTWSECFSEGGGHAGQRDAVLQAKAAKCRAMITTSSKPPTIATGKPGNIHYDISGRAYFVDPITNTVFMLQDTPTGSSTTSSLPSQEFTGLASDVLTPSTAASIPT
jgi:hypothetical protein